jgi:type IV secretory pathway VirB2 component (pilin)
MFKEQQQMDTKKTSSLWQIMTGDIAQCLFMCIAMVLVMGMGNAAFAGPPPGSEVGNAICQVPIAVITGNVGRGIATIGIIVLGVMATLGRITWTQAVVVGVGISVIFGAAAVVRMLATQGVDCAGL